MNWDAIGAIGEIIGALAVFISLGYLAVQIHQNTKAVRASALDSSINVIIGVRSTMYDNAELASIYLRGLQKPEDLDEEERLRFRLLIQNILWAIWNVYVQTESSGLSSSTWATQLPLLDRIVNTPGGVWFWSKYQIEFDETFRDEVENVMKSSNETN